MSPRFLLPVLITMVLPFSGAPAHAAGVTLAAGGKTRLPLVVGKSAGEEIRRSATELSVYLERITGAPFEITEGSGTRGLVLGLPGDFPSLPFEASFGKGPFERDHYRIISTSDALYLIGASPNAVQFAVWDLLHTFGYRLYFPHAAWEIVPRHGELRVDIDRLERPDFLNRSGPRGAPRRAQRPWSIEHWRNWQIRNRTHSSFSLHTGHAYDAIIHRNRKEFENHPEYLALRDGERGGNKFCISNPGLRALVVRDAVAQIERDPTRDSISLDPSDGGGWCECDACREMGSVSDRVVILANAAAEAINRIGHGEKFVGIYAYNHHSPPPEVEVHPRVVVSLATAFIKGDQSFEEILAGWSGKAKLIGIRDYYGLPVWHQSMPGNGKAGRPHSLAQTIRDQHAAGARFVNAESDDAWGSNGLGYYLASRLLWDVDTPVDAVIDDFLENCFGEAKEPMREFYAFIGSGPRASDHMIGTMYRLLRKARRLTKNPEILARLDSLVLYTRYAELWRRSGDQSGFDEVVNFLWRSRESTMCDSIGMFRYLNRTARSNPARTWFPGEPKSLVLPPERLRERGDEPFSGAEIAAFLEEGIRTHEVLSFAPLEFGDDLVPAGDALGLEETKPFGKAFFGGIEGGTTTRGELHNYTWIDDPPREIRLQVQTGVIYDVRGPAVVSLAHRGAVGVEKVDFYKVATREIPEDRQWHEVRFTAEKKGLYRVTWNERMSGTRVRWPDDLPRTVLSNEGADKQVSGRHSWFFYVPKGTKIIGAYSQAGAGGLFDGAGELRLDFKEQPTDYVSIEVPPGQDGKLWSVRDLGGRFRLLNVPPFASGSAGDLLLPREVVARDR